MSTLVNEVHFKRTIRPILNKTLEEIDELSQQGEPVRWNDVSKPASTFFQRKSIPIEIRTYVAQYLVSYGKFGVTTTEPFTFSDDVIDIDSVKQACEQLKTKLVIGKSPKASNKDMYPLKRLFADFDKFSKGINSHKFFKDHTKAFFKRSIKVPNSVTAQFLRDLKVHSRCGDYCATTGEAIWNNIVQRYDLKEIADSEKKAIVEECFYNTKLILKTAAKELDRDDKNYKKDFKLFVINCLLFKLYGEDALSFTLADFQTADGTSTSDFVNVIFNRLDIVKPALFFEKLKDITKNGESEDSTREKVKPVPPLKLSVESTGATAEKKKKDPILGSNIVTGRLLIKGSFYNFFPLFSWQTGIPRDITDAKERYSSYGTFLLSEVNSCKATDRQKLINGALYNIAYDDSEIEKVPNKKGGYIFELNMPNLFEEDRIRRADQDERDDYYRQVYYRVTPLKEVNFSDNSSPLKVKLAGYVSLSEDFDGLTLKSIPVMLDIGDRCIGPFNLNEDAAGNLTVRLKRPGQADFIYDCHDPLGRNDNLPALGVSWDEGLECAFMHFYSKSKEDFITDEKLLDIVAKETPKNTGLPAAIRDWIETRKENLGQVRTQLTADRLKRVLNIMNEEDSFEKYHNRFLEILLKAIKTDLPQKKELVKATVEAIVDDEDASVLIQEDPALRREVGNLEKSRDKLEAEIKKLEDSKADSEKKNKLALDKLEKKVIDKQMELLGIEGEIKNKNIELEEKTKKYEEAEQQLENFEERLNQTVDKVTSLAFEGSITSKIMEAASRWKEDKADNIYRQRIDALRDKVALDSRVDSQLNTYLCKQFAKFRNYHTNEFVNLFVCTAQSFLTVLAGSPGSGKTSLCNYLARVLGLMSLQNKPELQGLWEDHPSYANRYIPISVERGWTSKRDMIGYFNPLNRTFESVDPHRLECFRQLDYENKSKFFNLPYFLLLDEANLSSMEYYFADFMNICDERNDLSFITLGGNSRFQIPDTLRFLATINNDHTTEMLSPRLVDRTWIIQLPPVEDNFTSKLEETDVTPINWQSFKQTYQPQEDDTRRKEVNRKLKTDLKRIEEILSSLGNPISPRTRNAICNYVLAAQDYMKGDTCGSPYLDALDYAVAQKLLPMINGSGENYQHKLEEIIDILRKKSLRNSERTLEKVISRGNDSMGYYRFF